MSLFFYGKKLKLLIVIICTMCWIKLSCHPVGRQNLRRSFLSYSSIALSQSGHFNNFLFFVRTMGNLTNIQPPSQAIELEVTSNISVFSSWTRLHYNSSFHILPKIYHTKNNHIFIIWLFIKIIIFLDLKKEVNFNMY